MKNKKSISDRRESFRPKSFVKTDMSDQPVMRVTSRYEPKMVDELQLNPNDKIVMIESYDDGWAFGRNIETGVEGTFPLVCTTLERKEGNPLAENQNPCAIQNSIAIHSYSIIPEKYNLFAFTTIVVPKGQVTNDQILSNNQFFFQLQNEDYNDCLIGPIYNSSRVAVKLSTTEISATPTPQIDPTTTLPTLYWLLIIFGIIFLFACALVVWYMKRNTNKLAILDKPEEKDQTESKVQNIVVVPPSIETRVTSLSEPIQLPRIPSVNSLDLDRSFDIRRGSSEGLVETEIDANSIKEFLKDLDRPATPNSGMMQSMTRDDAKAIGNAFKDALTHPDWDEIDK
ncbi:polar growth protein [Boothiomyces sp. JEL0866]|nr:polar growth protein [Boothiomyces sp. JEL0866]